MFAAPTFPLQQLYPQASRLIFGCMGLGGAWNSSPLTNEDRSLANRAVDAALESGINVFDHADIYTQGKAERVFGEILRQRPKLREQIILQSKCGIRFEDANGPGRYDLSPEWLRHSVDGILQRLGIDQLDILLLHRPDPLMEPEQIAAVFDELKRAGKVVQFGVSNMHRHQMSAIQRYWPEPLVVNQIPISLNQLDWLEEGVLTGTPAGRDVNFAPGTLEYCTQHKVQLQAWGALAQGLFSGRELRDQPEPVHHTAQLVRQLAHDYRTSTEAIVLAWLMKHPVGIQPVVGTTHEGRIRACAGAPTIQLSREAWYALYVTARGSRLP